MAKDHEAPAPAAFDERTLEFFATALAKAMRSTQPPIEASTGLSPDRISELMAVPEPIRIRKLRAKSPVTGATFTIVVREEKGLKFGRVVGHEDYRYPAELAVPQSDGGALPDGAEIWADPRNRPEKFDPNTTPAHYLSAHFKLYLWQTYRQADLRMLTGRAGGGAEVRPEWLVDVTEAAKPYESTKAWTKAKAA